MNKTKLALWYHLSYEINKKSLKVKQRQQNKCYKTLWFGKLTRRDEVKGKSQVVEERTDLEETHGVLDMEG